MKILIVGNGGRENALALALSKNAEIFSTPENVGIANIGRCFNVPAEDIIGITSIAKEHAIDLVVVGPELPLTLGLADHLRKEGIKVFGPNKNAARIEGSKVFSKDLMKKYNIPTAGFEVFNDFEKAEKYISKIGAPIVIKADGLAAGKGAIVCLTQEEAMSAIKSMLVENKFGNAGKKIVVEEYMEGEEASILAVTDGKNVFVLPASQDHKRIFDNDKGSNTGGMGAYAPAYCVDKRIMEEITSKVLAPTISALEKEDSPYSGVLFAGLMLTKKGPKVVEFNCRFGDPETQAVLPLIEGDFAGFLMSCAQGKLDSKKIKIKDAACVCVVLASEGYPENYTKGKEIKGLSDISENVLVFHAGTKSSNDKVCTSGGRVLGIAATGENLTSAINSAYKEIEKITFDGMQYRKDIGAKGLKYN